MDYGHHDPIHSHRVYSLQAVERPPQPPCYDDGKPGDDDGNPYNLVSTYAYDPYGNLTSSIGSVANPWRFAGGYFDSSTGLYKFGTRYYNPGFGRWSQQDPVRGHLDDPTSLNRYLYAGDDPVNLTDPSGRQGDILACAENIALVFLTLFVGIGGIIAIIIALPAGAAGLLLIGAYLGISLAAASVIAGEIMAFMTYTSGVCDFSQ